MDSTWIIAVASAVGGALVGATTSLAGTVWVQRRREKRAARVRMHEELLPEFLSAFGSQRILGPVLRQHVGAEAALDALGRCAVIAGPDEEKLVAVLRRNMNQLTRPRTEAEGPEEFTPDGIYLGGPDRPHERAAFDQACQELEVHLARTIR